MPARYCAAGVAGIARNDVEITDFGLAVRHPVHVELAVHAKQEVARRIFPRLSLERSNGTF